MRKQKVISLLCLCLSLLLIVSLVACKETDEQNSGQPTASMQPTTAPIPTPPPIPYTDVAVDAPYYDAVVWAYKNGIASDGETFGPADACTRGQVMTFLWRAKGSPEPQATESPFSDVSSDDWFYKPALWASENSITTGTAFNPGNPCTNAEALTFLWRAEGKPMAVAASDAYYARPLSWAEINGLFAGAEFDPSAPCSRADLMSCLYWAEEQWTSAEEVRALQTEYEKIISQQKIYEVHGTGLTYADYIDVDGKVGLLTLGIDWDSYVATATVYADMDGHAGKYCEQVFGLAGSDNRISIYQADGQLYLGNYMFYRDEGDEYEFFKVENGVFVRNDHVQEKWGTGEVRYIGINGEEISQEEYSAVWRKYTEQKKLLFVGYANYEFGERGILPNLGVQVNGAVVNLSAKPYYSMPNEDIMVPIRDVLEAMGVAVYANPDASVILASTKSDTLAVTTYWSFSGHGFKGINNYYERNKTYQYSMNGGEFQDIPLEFTDGKAFAPLQMIVSLFGTTAEWNGEAGAMQIASNIPDSSRMSQDELKGIANFDLNQAEKMAASKGYEVTRFSHYDGSAYGLVFKNGKAIWKGYVYVTTVVEKNEYGELLGGSDEFYSIEVASDGTVTTNPDDKVYFSNPQF